MGNLLVGIILIRLVYGIIRYLINEKKAGKSLCGGNCTACGGGCSHCTGCATEI